MIRTLRILTIVATILVAAQSSGHEWRTQSILSEGKWIKMQVSQTGVHRLSYADIRNAGLDPAKLRIYGYGGAPLSMKFADRIIDDLCPVGYYRGTDYVLFYAQGVESWSYSSNRFSHSRNTCSEYGYYFLSDNAGEQILLNDTTAYHDEPAAEDVYQYVQLHLHERDQYNLVDVTGLAGGGRNWYGERMTRTAKRLNINMPTHDLTGEQMRVYIRMGSRVSTQTQLQLSVGENAVTAKVEPIMDIYNRAYNTTMTLNCVPAGTEQQTVGVQANILADADNSYLDYIELSAPAYLRMRNKQERIQTPTGLNTNKQLRYHLSGVTAHTQIWDVTDADSIRRVPTRQIGDTLCWIGSNKKGIRTYIAVNVNNSFPQPTIQGRVANQNIHGTHDAELVIITPNEFVSQAEEIADIHREYDGYNVAVVSAEDAYNEFSSGTPDVTAYRRVMKMLYDREQIKPRWLLLLGDGSFDNRKLMASSGNNTLLTYQADNSVNEVSAYVADDYFGWLENNSYMDDAGSKLAVSVGRLPVHTQSQADGMVAKLREYYTNEEAAGIWRQRLLFLADDGDHGRHLRGIEQAAKPLAEKMPQYSIEKIYLSAEVQQTSSTGESYPAAQSRMMNMIANGVTLFDFCGHGSSHAITTENILTQRHVEGMTNSHMGLWLMATCSFGHWDCGEESIAETAVLNPYGAAIAVFSAARTVYENQNETLNRYLTDTLFQVGKTREQMPTIGDAIRCAKNRYAYDSNKLAYNLLGDPAIRLGYPQDYRAVSVERPDTMRALSTNTIVGQIVDEAGRRVEDFNGQVTVTVFDKQQTIRTVDNDDRDSLIFQTYSNRIFSGRAQVKEGEFMVNYKVSKDIRYDYGYGRILYYAIDSTTLAEAIGYDHSSIVGGSSTDSIFDTMGPSIRLYLNAPSFRPGSRTTPTPRLYVQLYDENGINTSGAAIGHDIQLTIDNDVSQIYNLNEEFIADEGSYESGKIEYLLGPLKAGYHTLKLRAWDLLNNSSTETLDFTVVEDLDPQIYQLVITPGTLHVGQNFNVHIEHDRPDSPVEVNVQLFDIRGQKVYDRDYSYAPSISCYPAGITAGVYIYRITIKTTNSNDTSVSGKIICL